ncbi:hypothetical protein MTR_2g045000 [Medicago truncatula]|uniref:Uncharacterized protein n=1 Tax=Medicago truncatula TaxID=3880 RepID=G7IQD0_MEDTR|nr:hypothetical protein MTR_2g045000 [Medicago truncatula]
MSPPLTYKLNGKTDLMDIWYLFDSDCQISFDPVHIKSMTLELSTLQIRRHGYSGDLNIIISVDFSTLQFYAINMDVDVPEEEQTEDSNMIFFLFKEVPLKLPVAEVVENVVDNSRNNLPVVETCKDNRHKRSVDDLFDYL